MVILSSDHGQCTVRLLDDSTALQAGERIDR
jgi:hypothetical protein